MLPDQTILAIKYGKDKLERIYVIGTGKELYNNRRYNVGHEEKEKIYKVLENIGVVINIKENLIKNFLLKPIEKRCHLSRANNQ